MKNTDVQIVTHIPEPPIAKFVFGDTRLAVIWLLPRLYIGWEWLLAGWEKTQSPTWFGPTAGTSLKGFLIGAIKKTDGSHPDVSGWYAVFLQGFVFHHLTIFSNIVAMGELLVGVALLLGIFAGISAFFGAFMNMNYLFAGTISTNPVMFLCELFIILAWRVAGWYGIDRYLLPLLGTPWAGGKIFKRKKV